MSDQDVKKKQGSGKETQLAYQDKSLAGGTFKDVYGNCNKVCGYKRKDCPERKVNGGNAGTGGGGGGVKTNKTYNHCGKTGHLRAG